MLNLAAAKVFLCVEPTDMRTSYDTLALVVRDHLRGDPLSESWFVFRGKRRDRLKILYWDGDGYAICQKRLEGGTFEVPTATRTPPRKPALYAMNEYFSDPSALYTCTSGGFPTSAPTA
jgi:hypothetical protein